MRASVMLASARSPLPARQASVGSALRTGFLGYDFFVTRCERM